jgi:surface polysaccharide O-acyltransferase-like enzyme
VKQNHEFYVGLQKRTTHNVKRKKLMSPSKTNLDLIRCIATFLVVMQHAAAPVSNRFEAYSATNWWWANLYDSISRPCVPIFLFLSGALLLGRHENYIDFFNRRMKRILIPTFFWAAIYFYWGHKFHNFPIDGEKIIRGLLDTRSIYTHLWYLDLIIGLYIATPILRKILPALDKQDFRYLFWFWIAFIVINPMISATMFYWKGFQVNLISPYICYFVAGYYYERYGIGENERKIGWAALISGTFVTFVGMGISTVQSGHFDWFWYGYHSPSVFAQSFGGYLLLYYYGRKCHFSEKTKHWLQYLGTLTFGIYLLHPIIIEVLSAAIVLNTPFSPQLFATWWSIPIFTVLVLVISTILVGVARKWKWMEKVT